MKKILCAFIIIMAIPVFISCIAEYNNIPDLHTKWPFPVGVAVSAGEVLPSHPLSGLLRHFDVFTAATLYPMYIMPDPWTPTGKYRWEDTDTLLNYAEANGKKIRGHTLFWHNVIRQIMTQAEIMCKN